jgi:hypothetical protein
MNWNNPVFLNLNRYPAMPSPEPERRIHVRRSMHLPVACCRLEQGADTPGIYLGKISDVSMGGVCVQGNSDFDFTADNRLLLFVMGQKSGNALSAELPVEIKGEVMWRDSGKRRFGLRFFL